MSDTLFDLATDFLTAGLEQSLGRTVTVQRAAGGAPFDATAVGSQASVASLDDDGVAIEYAVYDFIFDATAWGVAFSEPLAGDTITTPDMQVYEVLRDTGVPCWRWCDSYRKRLRVHTKPIGEAGT